MGNALNNHVCPLKVLPRELLNKAVTQKLKNKLPITYVKQISSVLPLIYKELSRHLFTQEQGSGNQQNVAKGRLTGGCMHPRGTHWKCTFILICQCNGFKHILELRK